MLDLTRLVKFYLCAADLVCAIYRCELFCHLKSRVWRLIFEKTMETKYVYRDAVLLKAALQGKTFSLNAALCVRYPQGKQVRLDFEVCSPSSAFARRLQEYEAIYAKDGDDDGVRIDGLDYHP